MRKFIAIAMLSLVAFTAQAQEVSLEPSLFQCQNLDGVTLYFVIAPKTGEFMIFNQSGQWVNRGQFMSGSNESGTYFFAEVGDSVILWRGLSENLWRLEITFFKTNKTTEFNCG